jgi:hypothetical protein
VKREEVPVSILMVEENEWWSEAFQSMRDMTMRGGVKFPGEMKDRTMRGGVKFPGETKDRTVRGGVKLPGETKDHL